MLIHAIGAKDFLSFDTLNLDALQPGLNVIVGPNGAGKSNLVHALRLVTLSLRHSAGDSSAHDERRAYEEALRHNATDANFSVSVEVSFDQAWEQDLWLNFIRASVSATIQNSPVPDPHGRPQPPEISDAELATAVSLATIQPFLDGRIVVTWDRSLEEWNVGYEPTLNGREY